MDAELLLALCVLWISSTVAMCAFLSMWLLNEGEAFHPHSVEVDTRHRLFCVVSSETVCKKDFAVKSISAFVAPRGSSSSKIFSALIIVMSVSGFLGCYRWYAVKDATALQALIAQLGFVGLFLVSACELDVVPAKFFEDKLLVTAWLLERLGADKELPFSLYPSNLAFREFIFNSPHLHHIFDEDISSHNKWLKRYGTHVSSIPFNLTMLWDMLHALGAIFYVVLVPMAIIMNDYAEQKVAWITGLNFIIFCGLGYLTGEYLPVLKSCRGILMVWNPFIREPHFMLKLKRAIKQYKTQRENAVKPVVEIASLKRRTRSQSKYKTKSKLIYAVPTSSSLQSFNVTDNTEQFLNESLEADKALNTVILKFARTNPKAYIRIIGHILALSEMIAMLTPTVAIGIQWLTALCDAPPVFVMIELMNAVITCLTGARGCKSLDLSAGNLTHCILKS